MKHLVQVCIFEVDDNGERYDMVYEEDLSSHTSYEDAEAFADTVVTKHATDEAKANNEHNRRMLEEK